MKWRVLNAISRDVEREHLNKILAEIEQAVSTTSQSSTLTEADVRKLIASMLPASPSAKPIRIVLTGDVEGTGDGTSTITVDTNLTGDFLTEAPIDGMPYWRRVGQWERVSTSVTSLQDMETSGYVVYDADAEVYLPRSIEGTAGDIDVLDGDGIEGNTLLTLANVPDSGTGVLQLTEFDSKGRKTGTATATTDDLAEGVTNVYFTDERAQDAVGGNFEDTTSVELNYDPVTRIITAELSQEYIDRINNVLSVDGVAEDGDIIEYESVTGTWVPKKNPRELLIDGGNF